MARYDLLTFDPDRPVVVVFFFYTLSYQIILILKGLRLFPIAYTWLGVSLPKAFLLGSKILSHRSAV